MAISVEEASRRLGVNHSRVRQLLRAGDLRGRRLGNSWLVSAEDLARLENQVRLGGRPLAPKRAWAVIDLLDGGRAPWLSSSARSQVRRYLADLADPGPDGWRAALRGRSHVLDLVAHPAAVERLKRASGVRVGGLAAAASRGIDIVAIAQPIPEFYIDEAQWPALSRSLALREGAVPNLRVRIPKEAWPFADDVPSVDSGVSDAVLAADLLDHVEPRAVTAGAARLAELLSSWQNARLRA